MVRKDGGTQATQPLTRSDVIRVAVEMGDREGLESLSMRKLAAELGVEAMSLYHHVAGKDAILDAMVEATYSEIDSPEAGVAWRPALKRRTISARAVLLRHPWAVALMDSRRNPGPATLRHHDAVLGSLRRGGFSISQAATAFSLIDSYLFGFVLQELTLPFQSGDDLGDVAGPIMESMAALDLPHLTEMILDHALQPGYAHSDEFGIGLEIVLDGISGLKSTTV